jgi:hypothetical protein
MLLFRTIRRDDKDSSLPGQRRRRVAGLTQYTVVESARRDGRNPDTYYVCRSRRGMRWAELVTTLLHMQKPPRAYAVRMLAR